MQGAREKPYLFPQMKRAKHIIDKYCEPSILYEKDCQEIYFIETHINITTFMSFVSHIRIVGIAVNMASILLTIIRPGGYRRISAVRARRPYEETVQY